MLIGRVASHSGPRFVRVDDDMLVAIANPFDGFEAGRPSAAVGGRITGTPLAPTDPLLVVGIAQNGPRHESPVQAWLKSPRTVIPSGREVRLRRDAGATVAEGEIAVVIGRETSGLTAANAHEYVLGVTAVNDLSSPDRVAFDPRNFESKAGEGYTPLGPWIQTEVDLDDIDLSLSVDGMTVRRTSAKELPVSIRECMAYVASWASLGPGDVIMTGAPHSSAPIVAGAVVSVEVLGIRLVTPTT